MLEDKEANLIALRERMKERTEESFKPKNTFKLSSKIDKNGKNWLDKFYDGDEKCQAPSKVLLKNQKMPTHFPFNLLKPAVKDVRGWLEDLIKELPYE